MFSPRQLPPDIVQFKPNKSPALPPRQLPTSIVQFKAAAAPRSQLPPPNAVISFRSDNKEEEEGQEQKVYKQAQQKKKLPFDIVPFKPTVSQQQSAKHGAPQQQPIAIDLVEQGQRRNGPLKVVQTMWINIRQATSQSQHLPPNIVLGSWDHDSGAGSISGSGDQVRPQQLPPNIVEGVAKNETSSTPTRNSARPPNVVQFNWTTTTTRALKSQASKQRRHTKSSLFYK
jgi:hypothetical protein